MPHPTALTLALVLAAPGGQAAPKPRPSQPPDQIYLIEADKIVRTKPRPDAAQVATLRAFDLVRVREARGNWFRIVKVEEVKSLGWIEGDPANLMPDEYNDCIARLIQVLENGTDWPLDVKLDVMRKLPRAGFTKTQVTASQATLSNIHGTPVAKKISETDAGSEERWIYGSAVVQFHGDKAISIERPD
jgi:hypothetical protein